MKELSADLSEFVEDTFYICTGIKLSRGKYFKYFCQNEKLTKQASFLSHYRKDEKISIHTSKSVLEYSYYHIISP